MEVKKSQMKKKKKNNQKPKSQTFFGMNITTMQMRVEGAGQKDGEKGEEHTIHVNFE